MRLRDAVVDTRTVPASPDEEIARWLGDRILAWNTHGLRIINRDGDVVVPPPGFLLVRWPDGSLTITSPAAAALTYETIPADGEQA